MTILGLVLFLVCLGFVNWIVDTAPFIAEPMKAVIKWILIVVMAFGVLSFAFHFLGIGSFPTRLY